jgi:hypothetical protein
MAEDKKRVSVVMTDDEHDTILRAARAAGLNLASYLRFIALAEARKQGDRA